MVKYLHLAVQYFLLDLNGNLNYLFQLILVLILLLSGKNPGSLTTDLSIKGKRSERLYYSFLCLLSPGEEKNLLTTTCDCTKLMQMLPPCHLVLFDPFNELPSVMFPEMFSMAY